MTEERLDALLAEIRACRLCERHLPLGPRPVLQADARAPLRIISQAPGTRVHETGLPFNDPSGDRLRDWLGVDRATFYDRRRLALTPMGFCYPGTGRGGDLPPRPECAATWHPRLQPLMPGVGLTLLVGSFATAHYLAGRQKATLAGTVAAWRDYLPTHLPLPHPSPRNLNWFKRHPWFEADVLPVLRRRVKQLLGETRLPPVKARRARVEDAPMVAELTARAYAAFAARIGRPPQPMTVDYAAMIGEHLVFLVGEQGAPAAALVLKLERKHLLIWSIAVDPAQQGKRWGSRLVAFAEDEACKRGLEEVRLYTNALMTENIALYARLGYRETKREAFSGGTLVHMAKRVGR